MEGGNEAISTNHFSPLDNLKVNQEEVITVNDSVN
jgi:hypothetical protein